MKRIGFITLVLAVGIYLFGCGKKQQTLEEMQEPMSIEALGTVTTVAPAVPGQEVKPQVAPMMPMAEPKLETLPQGPYRPTNEEIQKALQGAGYYTAKVDGKMGPATKKAIQEFQKANGLQADGKVGPRTWAVLEKHLTVVSEAPKGKKNKKR